LAVTFNVVVLKILYDITVLYMLITAAYGGEVDWLIVGRICFLFFLEGRDNVHLFPVRGYNTLLHRGLENES